MSILGTVFNIASSVIPILGGLLGGIKSPDHVLIQELQDGSHIKIYGKVIVWHRNPAKIGTFVEPKDFVHDASDLSLVISGNDTGQYRLYAVNANEDVDGKAIFSKTAADGTPYISPYTVFRQSPDSPNSVDITEEVNDNPEANVTFSPVQLDLSSLPFALNTSVLTKRPNDVLSILLSNFTVPTVKSIDTYVLWSEGGDGEQVQLSWAWTTDANKLINGATITNDLSYEVGLNANININDPRTGFPVSLLVPPNSVLETSFATSDRPLTSVEFATTSDNTSEEFVKEKLGYAHERQLKAGKMVQFKGKPKLVLSQKGLRSKAKKI